jgi:hypothetical protein
LVLLLSLAIPSPPFCLVGFWDFLDSPESQLGVQDGEGRGSPEWTR